MDKESARLFANPEVRVAKYKEFRSDIDNACQAIFGRLLTIEDLVELIAAPDQSEVTVEVYGRADNPSIELHLGYRWFESTHDFILYKDELTQKRRVQFDSISIKNDAPDLLETRLFARQVNAFRKYGIDEIVLMADGYPGDPSGMVGYYVWPRLGFTIYLHGYSERLERAGFVAVSNTNDLFLQEGGAERWLKHGVASEAIFYLEDGSANLVQLTNYLEEKGIVANE